MNLLFNQFKNNLKVVFRKHYRYVIKEFAIDAIKKIKPKKSHEDFEIKEEINFDWISSILFFIEQQTAQNVVNVEDYVKDSIKGIIAEGISQGWSIYNIAKLIDQKYLEQIIPNRSEVIARTETIGAANFGSLAGAQQAEKNYNVKVKKIWIATNDKRTRKTHKEAEKESKKNPLPLDGKFKVGDSYLEYPGDQKGEAKEVINCRCSVGYVRNDT